MSAHRIRFVHYQGREKVINWQHFKIKKKKLANIISKRGTKILVKGWWECEEESRDGGKLREKSNKA